MACPRKQHRVFYEMFDVRIDDHDFSYPYMAIFIAQNEEDCRTFASQAGVTATDVQPVNHPCYKIKREDTEDPGCDGAPDEFFSCPRGPNKLPDHEAIQKIGLESEKSVVLWRGTCGNDEEDEKY